MLNEGTAGLETHPFFQEGMAWSRLRVGALELVRCGKAGAAVGQTGGAAEEARPVHGDVRGGGEGKGREGKGAYVLTLTFLHRTPLARHELSTVFSIHIRALQSCVG